MSQQNEVNGEDVSILRDCKRESSQNWTDVGIRVHQKVLVVLWKELLNESVTSLVDRLDDETSLFWLNVEGTALISGHSH